MISPPKSAVLLTVLTVLIGFLALLNRDWSSQRPSHITSTRNWYEYLLFADAVTMDIFDTTYYGFDEEGARNWEHMLPLGGKGHLVELADEDNGTTSNYTITLFHQLKCLELYHREYRNPSQPPSPLIRHCLNYLREQILCQLDTKLESVKSIRAQSARSYTSVCRDWTKVYEAGTLTRR